MRVRSTLGKWPGNRGRTDSAFVVQRAAFLAAVCAQLAGRKNCSAIRTQLLVLPAIARRSSVVVERVVTAAAAKQGQGRAASPRCRLPASGGAAIAKTKSGQCGQGAAKARHGSSRSSRIGSSTARFTLRTFD